jgi:hypothetical protein
MIECTKSCITDLLRVNGMDHDVDFVFCSQSLSATVIYQLDLWNYRDLG